MGGWRLGVVLAVVAAVVPTAGRAQPVVIDIGKEAFSANEQAFGRLMNGALEHAKSATFGAGTLVMGMPREKVFTFIFEAVGSYGLFNEVTPLNLEVGLHAGFQLLSLPRPSTDTLMGGRPYSFPPGSLAFSTSDGTNGMTFFGGLSIFSEKGESYVVLGYSLATEFENVNSQASPYVFTNIELIDRLRSFFLAGLSASDESVFSRLGGGLSYRLEGIVPAVMGSVPGDLEGGVYYAALRNILATQRLMAVTLNWYPSPLRLDPEGKPEEQALLSESRLELQAGSAVNDYDYIEDEGGFFFKVEAHIGGFFLGLNSLPANQVIDDYREIVGEERGGRHLGWQVGYNVGKVLSASIQRDYLLSSGFATPILGTTVALQTNLGGLFESGSLFD